MAWRTRFLVGSILGLVACSGPGGDGESSATFGTSTTSTSTDATSTSTSTASVSASASDSATATATATGTDTDGPKFDVMLPDAGETGGTGIPETCEDAASGDTTVGCLFFAIDSDLVVVYDPLQYAIAVANVQEGVDATVTLEVDNGAGWVEVEAPATVSPLDLHVFLPPDRHVDASRFRENGAYRITSDVPIIAYQFNPYEAGESFTSDAALLYPVPAWDTLHYVLNQPKIKTAQESYFTVVAATDGTEVTVTPSVATKAGIGVPAGTAGVPFMVPMNEGDVLQVAIANADEDPTGSMVESNADHPIAVFNGNTCALIPDPSGACDHLHEQLFGVRLWGMDFVGSRMPVRSTQTGPEPSFWQVMGSEDGTSVSFAASAGVTGVPGGPINLNAGEVLEFMTGGTFAEPGDFRVTADKPIAVASYMTGSSTVMPGGEPSLGDPSVVQLSPVEQFLPRYVVLVPPSYWMWDVGTVTRPAGVEVRLDGVAIDDAEFVAVDGSYEVARVPLEDGVHVLDGDAPFSIVVAGYDDDDSYAYLGGTGTAKINPVPEG